MTWFVQDTIRAELHPPHNDVSPKCWELIQVHLHLFLDSLTREITSFVQALLEKKPEHRASLWHLKEHEWILQEVEKKTTQLRIVNSYSGALLGGCKSVPAVWCHPLLWIRAEASHPLQVSVWNDPHCSTIFSGREVGGWLEEQDRPSAEAQVW